jgi:pilus assembly protein CpaB
MKRKARSLSCVKWTGKATELLPLGVGVLLTGIALAVAGERIAMKETDFRRKTNPVEVVVASVPIPAGDEFIARNLAKKPVPASGTGQRNVPAKDFELLLGARAKNTIGPGEPVLWTDVEEPYETESFSKTVRTGRRALTVGVDTTSSFSGLLQPGDRVDLLAARPDIDTPTWIRDIPVIAVDRHHNRLARPTDPADTTTVTLMVTPGEGAVIAAATGAGRLHWFLRNPDDNGCVSPRMSANRSGHSPVEIWKGGMRISIRNAGSAAPL